MREEWRPIPGYEGYYEASSLGRVRSVDRPVRQSGYTRTMRGRVRVLCRRPDGYLALVLSRDNRQRNAFVHHVVCLAFHGPRPDWAEHIRHMDGDKANNRPENLAYATAAENALDTIAHGRCHYSLRTHCPKGHPYDGENTAVRSKKSKYGNGIARDCRACHREADRKRTTARKQWREANDPTYKSRIKVTHCPKGHEYSTGNTYISKKGCRTCRECSRENTRRWQAARRQTA